MLYEVITDQTFARRLQEAAGVARPIDELELRAGQARGHRHVGSHDDHGCRPNRGNVGLGITGREFVITSYSIHYTKLYDERAFAH